ncbi:MAG: helix-turn-helix domain-containing protein [Verrucomicrobiales bacterium]
MGRTVRMLREKRELSQEKFAELTGHHRTYIGMLERGQRTPNVHTILKIANALDMTISELFEKAGL